MPLGDFEGASDLFVKFILRFGNDSLEQRTDTHYRSLDGFGSFNWRILFPLVFNYNINTDNLTLEI